MNLRHDGIVQHNFGISHARFNMASRLDFNSNGFGIIQGYENNRKNKKYHFVEEVGA